MNSITLLAGAACLFLFSNKAIGQERPEEAIPPCIIQRPEIGPGGLPEGGFISQLWNTATNPQAVIPYDFEAEVTPAHRDSTLKAMAEWEKVANIDFIPRTGQSTYVRIYNDAVNNAPVGSGTGERRVNIVSWNSRFVIVHEFGHILGINHEQERPDRDTYVQYFPNNVCPGQEHNFDVDNNTLMLTSYDFESVMHYSRFAFRRCLPGSNPNDCPHGICQTFAGNTLEPQPAYSGKADVMGQRARLSTLDKVVMRMMYPFNNDRFFQTNGAPFASGRRYNLHTSLTAAKIVAAVPQNQGGHMFIQPGEYPNAEGTYGLGNRAITLIAPKGTVILK